MLQKIVICVLYNPDIVLNKKSYLDESLSKIANQNLLRENTGISDSFLFLVCGGNENANLNEKLLSYGFKKFEIISIDIDEDDSNIDDCSDFISYEIDQWLYKNHKAVIIDLIGKGYCPDDSNFYDDLYWFIGFESKEDTICNIDVAEYAEILPDTHRDKASTWLSILKEALIKKNPEVLKNRNHFALYAACLCEWLHGFEAASENSWNYFEPELVIDALEIDTFYLAQIFDKIEGVGLQNLFSDSDSEFDLNNVIEYITEDIRVEMINALLSIFNSDTILFCTLYTSIWPEFDKKWFDSCADIIGLETIDYGDIEKAWTFVQDGWHDSAYKLQ
jgi:hypothetical protein